MAEAASVEAVGAAVGAPPEADRQPAAMVETPVTERPTCVIILGMAGSGKTTFVQVNLDTGHPSNFEPLRLFFRGSLLTYML